MTSNGGTASNLVPGAVYVAQMHYRNSVDPGGVQSSAQHAGITVEAPPREHPITFMFPEDNAIIFGLGSNAFQLDYTLGEVPAPGTVVLEFFYTGGTADNGSPHIIKFQPSFETAGTNAAMMPGLPLHVPLTASHLPSRRQASTR